MRLAELDERTSSSSAFKRKNCLSTSLVGFLRKSGCQSLRLSTPDDVRRFLIWKDSFGKTIIHDIQCPFLGIKGSVECDCPKRLASATVEGVIQQLVNIFEDNGMGRSWDVMSNTGNPALAPTVKEYLKLVKAEQARAHVLPKQAKPIFLTKIKAICSYINREIQIETLSLKEKFILFRDQAWFKLQFFAGDRASDLSIVIAQEVRMLNDGSGLFFQHTFGKTLRGGKGRHNSFVIKKCCDLEVCPVKGLLDYVQFCKLSRVNLSTGYLFRIVSENGRVLDKPVNYSVVYERLRYYLSTLGLYEGETPHSFRSGCAITMALTGSADNVDQMMHHIGWFGRESAEYYSRKHTLVDSSTVASKLAKSVELSGSVELEFKRQGDFSCLKKAFVEK